MFKRQVVYALCQIWERTGRRQKVVVLRELQ
jgi:hypothetical protein